MLRDMGKILGKKLIIALVIIIFLSLVFGAHVWADIGTLIHNVFSGLGSTYKHSTSG